MAKTSNVFLRGALQHIGRFDLDQVRVCRYAGLKPEWLGEKNVYVPNEALVRLIQYLWTATGDESLGFLAQPMKPGTWGLICDYSLQTENLAGLLAKVCRITPYLGPEGLDVTIAEQDRHTRLEFRSRLAVADEFLFWPGFLAVVWHRYACWTIDAQIPLVEVCFQAGSPGEVIAGLFEEIFGASIRFDQPADALVFPSEYLSRPIVRSRRELQQWLRESPADLMYLPGREQSIKSTVKGQLRQCQRARQPFPSFDDICRSLASTPQVVRKRLSEEGTSYQQIKDAVRSDLARELLSNPALSIAEISERVGFTEAAAFSRAFKKWTGKNPATYRERYSR